MQQPRARPRSRPVAGAPPGEAPAYVRQPPAASLKPEPAMPPPPRPRPPSEARRRGVAPHRARTRARARQPPSLSTQSTTRERSSPPSPRARTCGGLRTRDLACTRARPRYLRRARGVLTTPRGCARGSRRTPSSGLKATPKFRPQGFPFSLTAGLARAPACNVERCFAAEFSWARGRRGRPTDRPHANSHLRRAGRATPTP